MSEPKREAVTYVIEAKYDKATGHPISRRIRLDGLLHTPPNGEPSEVIYDREGRQEYLSWHHAGKLHKTDGPASIDLNPENGVTWVECFQRHGDDIDKADGPHTIFYDPYSGEVLRQQFSDGTEIEMTCSSTPLEPEV